MRLISARGPKVVAPLLLAAWLAIANGAAAAADGAPVAAPPARAAPGSPAAEPSEPARPATTATPPAPATVPATTTASLGTGTDAAWALERARAAYEYGDLEMVVDSARMVAEGRAHPSPAQRVQALRLLGIGLFLTGRPEGAETAFFDLLRQKPGAKLDPTHTRPDVVAFFETVRSRHAEELQQAAGGPSRKHLLLALLPPVGQFQNGDRGRGVAVAVIEAISLGTAIGSYVQLKTWVNRSDQTFGPHTDDANKLKVVNNVSIGVFAATVLFGIVDGIANFHHDDDEPPLAWLTPGGLTLRF